MGSDDRDEQKSSASFLEDAKPIAAGVSIIGAGAGVMTATSTVPPPVMDRTPVEEIGFGLAIVLMCGGTIVVAKRLLFGKSRKK